MKTPENVLAKFNKYIPQIDSEIKKVISECGGLDMYKMMEYFLGYRDKNFKPVKAYTGKRFRSSICMIIADFYGVRSKAVELAASIEIFHNFTLIHDDIEDNDQKRRGRPTVWKLWGLNHGINTGDAQLVIAGKELLRSAKKNRDIKFELSSFVNDIYLRVAEGQFMDFELSDAKLGDRFVTEKNYLKMIENKSAVLVAASAAGAGMVAKVSKSEQKLLWDYCFNLGMAYQLNDDIISIWGKSESTGKEEVRDILERKKTLPIIYAAKKLKEAKRANFMNLYNSKKRLSRAQVASVKTTLEDSGAREYTWKMIDKCLEKSRKAVNALNISAKQKSILLDINEALIPDMKWWDA